jgi:fused signal recognition particle receptor
MQGEWLQPAITAAIVLLVLVFFVAALRKARRRRRAEFSDDEPRVGAAVEPAAAAPEPGPADDEAAEEPPAEVEVPSPEVEQAEAEPTPLGEAHAVPIEAAVDPAIARGLAKTHASLWGRLSEIFTSKPHLDQAVLADLEEALLMADVGLSLATRLLAEVRDGIKRGTPVSAASVRESLKARLTEALLAAGTSEDPLADSGARPEVILFVGVNGAGKTTTIGKVAAQLRSRGKSVVLAAGDTFRAAAVEQLGIWAERTGSKLFRGDTGADPASVIFNAVTMATQTGADVLLADTAGRLHTKTNLMDEIRKVKRAAGKAREGAPDHTWLVVDATTGQNALQQAREFHQALGLSGVILTKLDGTAKGGVVVAISDALKLPVRFVGVGEKSDDLRPFVAEDFVTALFAAPAAGGHS